MPTLCPEHDHDCDPMTQAVVHLDWAYDQHVCRQIDHLHCNHFMDHLVFEHAHNDQEVVKESICGTDLKTYHNQ